MQIEYDEKEESKWTATNINHLIRFGVFLAGFEPERLAKLPPSVFKSLTPGLATNAILTPCVHLLLVISLSDKLMTPHSKQVGSTSSGVLLRLTSFN